MIERLLPDGASGADSFDDLPDELYPEEHLLGDRAVEGRRLEARTTRTCARRALAGIGVPPGPVPRGGGGAPLWPPGVVGSLTHCRGYRAAAVARADRVPVLGIDAEPADPLPEGVLDLVALPAEREMLARLAARDPGVPWDRLLFCVKESVYKAWYPLAGRWLGFEDAEVALDVDGGAAARLLVPGPDRGGRPVSGFRGRWLAGSGLLVVAVSEVTAG